MQKTRLCDVVKFEVEVDMEWHGIVIQLLATQALMTLMLIFCIGNHYINPLTLYHSQLIFLTVSS